MKKQKRLNFRVDEEVYNKLRKEAYEKNETMTSIIERLVKENIK